MLLLLLCLLERKRGEGNLGCGVGRYSQESGRCFFLGGGTPNPLGRKLVVTSGSQCGFVISLALLERLGRWAGSFSLWCGDIKGRVKRGKGACVDWIPQPSEVFGFWGARDSRVLGDEMESRKENGFESDLHSACLGEKGWARCPQPCCVSSLLTLDSGSCSVPWSCRFSFPRLVSAIAMIRYQGAST